MAPVPVRTTAGAEAAASSAWPSAPSTSGSSALARRCARRRTATAPRSSLTTIRSTDRGDDDVGGLAREKVLDVGDGAEQTVAHAPGGLPGIVGGEDAVGQGDDGIVGGERLLV